MSAEVTYIRDHRTDEKMVDYYENGYIADVEKGMLTVYDEKNNVIAIYSDWHHVEFVEDDES